MRKRYHKSETIQLEQVSVSSEDSFHVKDEISGTYLCDGSPKTFRRNVSNRSYSVGAAESTLDKAIRTLPPWGSKFPGLSSKSSVELRQRKSSFGYGSDLTFPLRRPSHLLSSIDCQVEQLYTAIKGNDTLMEDSPLSQQMRVETLRKMPTSLTTKRSLKHKLGTSICLKHNRSPISLRKRMKYFISMSFSRFKMWLRDVGYMMELWYGSIKTIEGHFGTSTATYFRFLRWLFLINCCVFILSFGFLIIPQLLVHMYEPRFEHQSEELEVNSTTNSGSSGEKIENNSSPYNTNAEFAIGNLFTGEGWLENTVLYYGFYSNESISLIPRLHYSIPGSYIFTMGFCYALMFILIAHSAAKSYRKSYMETGGGVKHVYSHKLFCGWDFGIATEQGALLKRQSIVNEFKELLQEESEKLQEEQNPTSVLDTLMTISLRVFVNLIFMFVLCSTGMVVWILLSYHKTWNEPGNSVDNLGKTHPPTVTVSLSVTLILLLVPMFFSYITCWERYRSPQTALYITLWRTFGLEVVVLCVLLGFWLHSPDSQCWETSLGQEIYRLVIMDLIITIFGTYGAELIRSRIHILVWDKIGIPEFDIARNTLNLIYNQSLFWIGFFFSPLLALIILGKTFLSFYVKRMGVMHHCQPSARAWRAAQTETIFLVLSFLSLFGILFALGFVFTRVPSSNCGPFRGYQYMYQMVIIDILSISKESLTWQILSYALRPGVVGCILVSMCGGIYYVRAVARARAKMVRILREMLVLEARDKEYLLANMLSLSEDRVGLNASKAKREHLYSERSSTFEFQRRREDHSDYLNEALQHVGDVTQSTLLNDSL